MQNNIQQYLKFYLYKNGPDVGNFDRIFRIYLKMCKVYMDAQRW